MHLRNLKNQQGVSLVQKSLNVVKFNQSIMVPQHYFGLEKKISDLQNERCLTVKTCACYAIVFMYQDDGHSIAAYQHFPYHVDVQ